ncbi:unnamed protein product [Prorocentrum cordatum]|uniref:Uncharacterized protein n=1 Tax=Prorocentrum cordatum TaxID=2364126 RepID=A0ABN9UR85_9DINO|nr:unnamed protein product [Polarella glacialis]
MLRSGAAAPSPTDPGGHRHGSLGARAIVFEQASVYLPSSDAAQLGASCWTLEAFLDGAHRPGAYWLLQQGAARGRYEGGVAWLHALAELRSAAAFAEEIRRVKVPGQLEFHSGSVLRACIAALAGAGGRPFDFAVTWRFAPSRRRHSPGLLELRLGPIDIIGGVRPSDLEICVSGTVPAVRAMGHMQADLLPVRCGGTGGSGVRPHPIMLWLGEGQCEEFLQHHQIISLMCIDVGEQEASVRPLVA